jgi:TatD DNase family protein
MLIDSHCHLIGEKYDKPPKQLIEEANSEGIGALITVGTSLEESEKNIALTKEFENVFTTVGVYPHEDMHLDIKTIRNSLIDLLETSEKIVGIGECGIDISDWKKQRLLKDQEQLFKMQIDLALEHDLPIVIHNRNADTHMINILESYKGQGLRGVLHCFTSPWSYAKKILDLGLYVSFSGILTYPSGKDLLETAKNAPADKILVETDAPWLPPQGHRGEVNEPKYVKITAKTLADTRNISYEKICETTRSNTCKLFTRMALV